MKNKVLVILLCVFVFSCSTMNSKHAAKNKLPIYILSGKVRIELICQHSVYHHQNDSIIKIHRQGVNNDSLFEKRIMVFKAGEMFDQSLVFYDSIIAKVVAEEQPAEIMCSGKYYKITPDKKSGIIFSFYKN